MQEKLLNELKDFMLINNWENFNVPERAKAIFTTICLIGELGEEQRSDILRNIYSVSMLEDLTNYEDFEFFMTEYVH